MEVKAHKRRLDRIHEKLSGSTPTSRSETGDGPSQQDDGDGPGWSRGTANPSPARLQGLMRVANWNAKRKAKVAKTKLETCKESKEETQTDQSQRQPPEMTREKSDVTRDMSARKGSLKARKMSMGVKDQEKLRNTHSLLSQALRKDAQRLLKKFKLVIRCRLLLQRWLKLHSVAEVTSTHPFYMQYQMINDLSPEAPSSSAIDFKASYYKANKQMKMSQEAVRILTMPPENRTKDEIYYAMIALRSIDSISDYPLRMQEALARHGMFQSFGPKRIIVKQGHQPDCFYFILFGTVVVATLEIGEPYAKTRVTLRRGENFGELAIAHRTARQSTVLTMEYTEFLTIDCDTYENIFMVGGVKTIHDPDHNKFMRSLFFLRDFPIEALQSNPKAMEFCYFRRNAVMVHDSNSSEWIYIVKSGSLRVYKMLQKCYSTVNKRTGNYRVHAHTDGYHSFLNQKAEYNRYANYHGMNLPPPLGDSSEEEEEDHHTHVTGTKFYSEDKENLLSLPLLQRVERLIRPRTATGGVIATYGHSTTTKRNVQTAMGMYKDIPKRTEISTPTPTEAKPSGVHSVVFDDQVGKRTLIDDFENSRIHSDVGGEQTQEGEDSEKKKKKKREVKKKDTGDVNPNVISRGQNPFVTQLRKKGVTAADLDPEFVLIQTLTKGMAFGIQQVFIDDQPSLILISGGAECVMVNKKAYREHVNPNMAQQLKQQISPFPSDSDLQHNLQVRINWNEYRKITLNNLLSEQRGKKPIQKLHKRKGKYAWH